MVLTQLERRTDEAVNRSSNSLAHSHKTNLLRYGTCLKLTALKEGRHFLMHGEDGPHLHIIGPCLYQHHQGLLSISFKLCLHSIDGLRWNSLFGKVLPLLGLVSIGHPKHWLSNIPTFHDVMVANQSRRPLSLLRNSQRHLPSVQYLHFPDQGQQEVEIFK